MPIPILQRVVSGRNRDSFLQRTLRDAKPMSHTLQGSSVEKPAPK